MLSATASDGAVDDVLIISNSSESTNGFIIASSALVSGPMKTSTPSACNFFTCSKVYSGLVER